jgi:hypothetical protein
MRRLFAVILIAVAAACLTYRMIVLGALILGFALLYLRYGTVTDAFWEMVRHTNRRNGCISGYARDGVLPEVSAPPLSESALSSPPPRDSTNLN